MRKILTQRHFHSTAVHPPRLPPFRLAPTAQAASVRKNAENDALILKEFDLQSNHTNLTRIGEKENSPEK